jgi:hypothetical protein
VIIKLSRLALRTCTEFGGDKPPGTGRVHPANSVHLA